MISGTESVPIQIIGDAQGEHTYDTPGQIIIDGQRQRQQALAWQGVENWTLSNINFRNFTTNGIMLSNGGAKILNCNFDVGTGYAIFASPTGDITIEGCVFDRTAQSGHLIWVTPSNRTTPTSVTITRNDMSLKGDLYLSSGFQNGSSALSRRSGNARYSYGIIVYGWGQPKIDQIEISNNQISDSYLPIYSSVYSSANANTVIANNTITGSLYSVYSYAYYTQDTSVINNIVDTCYFGHISYAYRSSTPTHAGLIENNMTYDMSRYRRDFESSIIQGSPMFADAPAGDFSLMPGSPAIDAGTLSNAPLIDIAGRTRPSDGDSDGLAQIDIGAHELVNAPTRVKVVEWREIGVDQDR